MGACCLNLQLGVVAPRASRQQLERSGVQVLHAVGSPVSGRTSERRVDQGAASSALQPACSDSCSVDTAAALSSVRCPLQVRFSSAGHW